MANETNDNDAINIEPVNIDLAKDTAVNMALRILFTQIFTPYSIVSLDGKGASKNMIDEVSNLIDQHMKDLQLAFSDFLLRGKCYLYRFNYINPLSAGFKELKHYSKEKGRTEYCIQYYTQRQVENWWENDSAEETQVVIAPPELRNKFPPDVEFYDEQYLGVYHNPIPIHETIQQLADQKNTLALQVMPLMAQKALIPTIVGITDNIKAGQIIKKALSNHQNRTRVYIPASPDEVKLETISIGRDIPTDLIETMLYYYDSAIFMGLGTSISIVKASGQELTTSRTVDRNILRIVQGYQQEIERWIADQLDKMGYKNIWVKFANPDPDWELNMLEKIKMINELQQNEDDPAPYDFSSLIERILPCNEYGEIYASFPDLTEEEAEKAVKYAQQGKKGLGYIDDEEKLKELEKKNHQLEKIISKLEKVGDKFGKKSMQEFINWVLTTYEQHGYDGMSQNWDELISSFTQEEVDKFFLDYVAPALNSLKIYDDLDQQTIDILKQHWYNAFYNIYSSYSQQFLDVLTDGVQKGLGEDEIVRNLKKVAEDVKGQRLQLRAREEINKTYNISRAKKFWNDKVVYVTMEDKRVRPAHKKLNGLVFVPAEHPELIPPLGYNCRCTITPYRGD